jgi:MraZ protein
MSHFRGRYDYTVDDKGRVNIPAKFRKSLNPKATETFVVCRAPGNCLRAYPQDVWELYEEEMGSRPQTEETVRLWRLLYNTVSDSTLDAQGRITLTALQIKLASIMKNVSLVGQGSYIEIWDTEKFDQSYGAGDDFDAIFFKSVAAGLKKNE